MEEDMKIRFALAFAFFAVAPGGAPAETQEEQNACIGDAFGVCGHEIPDRQRVASCLAANLNRLSRECRAVMLRYQRPAPQPRYSSSRSWSDR
jgi:hypothetical protein